ncbi:carbohydrate esterase family 4 protein [Pleomassaria siparia CBS 279.74]|uniref:Carbohydrate esterase family 4 protein n=1 Tax=Pleomassaria siparia CBS 279.74 TaxID=1314801 RepID=A0A6G1KJ85_9PLEO|nr:carbohydrate esterase family 4 protein [Pleomassaria siparia CBS 279.74]
MHFSPAIAAIVAVAPLVAAHGDGSALPRIIGLNVKDLKARSLMSSMMDRVKMAEIDHHEKRTLEARQNTNGQCGGTFGSCADGYCCSVAGWCGNTGDYCYSPGCQYEFGPGCPENVTPAGTNTSTVDRTQVGSVEYGGNGIYGCVNPGDIALTYDDGPLDNFTNHILDIFASYNAKATFFITGNNLNKGEIDTTASHTADIQRMHTDGHQIASHTWTHLDLSKISVTDRRNQMWKNEMAFRNILGFFPTYMRPPYSSCDVPSGCEADMATLGYHVTYFNVDTDDYEQDDPNKIQNSKDWFLGNITAGGATSATSDWLTIAHDIHAQTAYNLTDYMLSTLTGMGYKPVTVGDCLGDPAENWYRNASGASTSTPASSAVAASTAAGTASAPASTANKAVSTDATCGGTAGHTCQGSTFGNCCSAAGWCGSTSDYCGTGCQTGFGTCTGSGSGSSVAVVAAVSTVRPSSSVVAVTSTHASSAAAAASATSATKKVTTDATCGGTAGLTCKGSTFGNCCSRAGWCGSTASYCGTGCQKAFGTCT